MTDPDLRPSLPGWLAELSPAALLPGTDRRAQALYDPARLSAAMALNADEVERVQPVVADLLAAGAAAVGTPVCLLNVVLTTSQVIAGAHGLTGWLAQARATPVEEALCAEVVRTGEPYVVPDLAADPDTRDNPLCTIDHLRAYAGVPLRTAHGHVLGALCVLDTSPRPFTTTDVDVLHSLAREAVRRLEEAVDPGSRVS